MVKISCVTPSVRPEMLEIVGKCLERQIFKEWEWLIGAPEKLFIPIDEVLGNKYNYRFIAEPDKNKGDFYCLNKCWNRLFKQAQGELIVSIVDGLWFPLDTLTNLWAHYEANPKACITTVGNQYDETLVAILWKDPRMRLDQGSFYQVDYPEMELCLASFPRQAVIDCKGIKSEFDKFCALSEKEMCARMEKLGYSLWIDQSIEYKAIYHDRIGGREEWDRHYFEGCKYMEYCMKQINQGKELMGDL